MRVGEIVTAGVLALLSIYFMYKASANGIGYAVGTGPQGGFWPFWLACGMLASTGVIAFNWVRRASAASRSDEPVLDSHGIKTMVFVGGGIIGFVALIDIVSMYGAVAIFLLYYLKLLGRHSWRLTLPMVFLFPLVLFFFFEGLMQITMPTGLSFTDPVYNVLYDIIY
ncbi:tripartite tricarboxylate transporter TctB family protein [Roseovarius autotrophicus]|uniref:tripartite tricarboxylate transporter TctB family protein n=1 Tax=Roseovarius autotrophicus TaxID=2824121 RepID=UPI001B35FF47|nr:tripartite tricarboxylate transporter TctB family protein [Roseovarius autotrophicus]